MYNVKIIAETILSFNSMGPKKLQKLCYYVQAHYLAKYSKPLLDTTFEAWVHGPVSNELYQKYRMYGWNYIPKSEADYFLPSKVMNVITDVYDCYSKYSADELEQMTHEETPWLEAREGLPEFQSSNRIISNRTMREFYSSRKSRSITIINLI